MLSRRKSRILVVQSLYSLEFNEQDLESLTTFAWHGGGEEAGQLQFSRLLLTGVIENLEEIDKTIKKNLLHWRFERLGKVELAIMRLGVYELLYMKEVPRQIVINEAVEIANAFASPQTFKIINGVLDAIRPEEA